MNEFVNGKSFNRNPLISQIATNLNEDATMIDYRILKNLILEVFSANPFMPVKELVTGVERLAAYQNVFPSRNDCQRYEIYSNYYDKKRLSPQDRQNIAHIIWQLIRDNLLVIDEDRLN